MISIVWCEKLFFFKLQRAKHLICLLADDLPPSIMNGRFEVREMFILFDLRVLVLSKGHGKCILIVKILSIVERLKLVIKKK